MTIVHSKQQENNPPQAQQTTKFFDSFNPKPSETKNLFENIVKKIDAPSTNDLNSICESNFQSLVLEVVKLVCQEFLFQEKQLTEELACDLINEVVKNMTNSIIIDEIRTLRDQRLKLEQLKQKENEINFIKSQQMAVRCEEIYNNLLQSLIEITCENFLNLQRENESIIYDEILMCLFQKGDLV